MRFAVPGRRRGKISLSLTADVQPILSAALWWRCRTDALVTIFVTTLDICHRFRYRRRILLIDGRLPEASLKTEQERFPRADLHSAPGRLWASCSPVLRPVRG